MSDPVSDIGPAPRLGFATKVSYGLGSIAQGSAGAALAQGIIAYYLNLVLGLPPLVVGSLILVSLVIDAIADPLIGRWSDTFRSPWGRRHPFMYASAIPIAAAMYLFWNPPHGLPTGLAAAFALAMLVILRLSLSLYEIPSAALAPELAPDYHERTDLLAFRWFFWIGGLVFMLTLLLWVFVPQDKAHPVGLLNKAGYARYGAFAAVVTLAAILYSSSATHRYIPRLSVPPVRRLTLVQTFGEIAQALVNPSLVVLIVSGVIGGVARGVNDALSLYMNTYFWGLSSQVTGAMLALIGPLSIVGIALAPVLSRALDKKRTMITVFMLSVFTGVIPVSLRLLGLMPPNGSPWVPIILFADLFVTATLALIGAVIITSMVADVAEDNAVKTGVRSEGLLFATNGLVPKVTVGIGGFVAGLLLTLVHFPRVVTGAVDPSVMRHLALLALPVGLVLNLVATGVLVFYRIDKKAHERNLEALAHAERVAPPHSDTGAPAVESRPVSPSIELR